MKLLFAIKHLSSASGGAERVLCTVCSDLAERGHNVSIVTLDTPGGQPFYHLDARVKLIDLAIGDAAQPTGVFEAIKRMKALRHIVVTEKPDVAVGFMHSMFIPLAFSLVGTGISTLGSEHIVPEHYQKRRFQFLLLSLSARLLKKITVLSESIRSSYPATVKNKMVVVPNPIEKPTRLTKKAVRDSTHTILNVGRLNRQKDQATLIKAFAKITEDFPQWHLKIFGEGPLREELERLIEVFGLQSKVTLPGVTSAIDVEYQLADIFVISSSYEAFGLATAEAMSHGLPVIGFADCPGTNELIQNDVTGLLVDPPNDRVQALASTLSDLIKNRALQEKLSKAGQQEIEKRFSTEQVCEQWEDLLFKST
ncbi:glycosyltransferase family 4 protein [Vibrio profundum]|uniref:glycosyltransferase family 4 protein n=1 Tax=Vibrio profundum TaxID=2910247 RepID=UPI003D0C06C1